MSEKKICSIDFAVDEPMYLALKGLTEADGITVSELMRMLASTYIEERAAYFARLHSIFGDAGPFGNAKKSGTYKETAGLKSIDGPIA